MPRHKKLTPQQAKTFPQICSLPRDSVHTKRGWFMVDEGCVHIYNQVVGEASTENITLTRADFEKFWRWYSTGKV